MCLERLVEDLTPQHCDYKVPYDWPKGCSAVIFEQMDLAKLRPRHEEEGFPSAIPIYDMLSTACESPNSEAWGAEGVRLHPAEDASKFRNLTRRKNPQSSPSVDRGNTNHQE
jgi:hypothetical protein